MQRHKLQQHTRFYSVPSLTMKVFSNMKRSTKGFSGQEVALFPTMLDDTEPSPSPSRITSSPSPIPSPSINFTIIYPHNSTSPINIHLLNLRIGVLEADMLKTQKNLPMMKPLKMNLQAGEEVIDEDDSRKSKYHALKMKPKTIAQARRNMIKYLKNQGNFKISQFKGMSYNDIRPIFEKIWDFNQNIMPMDTELGSGKQKSSQKSPVKSPAKEKSPEKVVEEVSEKQEALKEGVKDPAAKRKKSIPRKSTRKRQKLEEDAETDELKGFLDIVPREETPIEVEFISTKFPTMDWKTCVLTETFMYYQVFRGDGSSKNYKVLSEMLEDFDRLDVEELYRLVKNRYSASSPEGFDLMLWGDLHTLFEPDKDDEIWRDQHEYNLLSWRLCDFCGIHILLMDNGLAIHMLTEKKYPLSQEMLTKMLSRKLEVDHESSQAFELLRFIRSQVQK
ncbi:hypothetical protein Tco_0796481 [Tanacetum coccineum]